MIVALGVLAGAMLVSTMGGLVVDERWYGLQAEWFLLGRFETLPGITMFPTYHALLAATLAPLGEFNDHLARMVNLLVGLLLLPLAWSLVRAHWPDAAAGRTAQVFFQPLLFPFFFLVYTEAWSLAALAAMMWGVMRGRYFLAALAGAAGILLRQDFAVWAGLAWALAALAPPQGGGRTGMREILRPYPLLAVLAAFAAFVAWNNGVAVGDRGAHGAAFNITNLYLFLLCGWLVFLPVNVFMLPRIVALGRRPGVVVLMAAAFVAYMTTFSNPHPYNQYDLRFFLRNEVLHWLATEKWVRALAFIPMWWMALTFAATRLAERRMLVIHLFAAVAVILHPLVEQRYYLPAMLLFQLWREPMPETWERATLAFGIVVSLAALLGIARGWFFL
jgi:alpha-1,2-glucosyltransferase